MNGIEQDIFDIIMKHMRINGSENCSTSEFESDVEDAAKEIAAKHTIQADECPQCHAMNSYEYDEECLGEVCVRCGIRK
jgi:hypothetical protein